MEALGPGHCSIQTPKHWRGNEDCWGDCQMRPEGPKIDAEGRERVGFLGMGSKPHFHQLGGLGERCERPDGVQSGPPSARRVSTIFSTQGSLS